MMKIKTFISKAYLLIVLLLSIIFFSIFTDTFLSVHNLTNIFIQNVYVVIATMGIAMVMIAGGVDMSVSYEMGLVSCVCGALLQYTSIPTGIIILIGLGLGVILGMVNGLITITLKVHPMVATLATMSIYQGIVYVFCDGKTYYGFPDSFKALGQMYLFGWLPVSVLIMLGMFFIAYIVLNKTYYGRNTYALGGNEEAARMAGISTVFMRVTTFMVSSVFIAAGAIMLTSRTGSASPSIASDAVFTCISACVLGGISFTGGEGNIANIFISVMILGVFSNGMQMMGLSIYSQYITKGVLLALAIAFDNAQKKHHAVDLAKNTLSTTRIANKKES